MEITCHGSNDIQNLTLLFSSYTDDDHLCGELLIRPEGTIQSVDRNEDGLYDPNSKCYWILVAPVSTTIRIEFLSITLEESNDCIYDFIAVCTSERGCILNTTVRLTYSVP